MPDFGEQLGAKVVDRRVALGMTQADLVEVSGVSEATIRPLEKRGVLPKRPATRSKIARALQWRGDALDLLAAGETPKLDWGRRDDLADEVATLRRDLDQLQAQMKEMLDGRGPSAN